MRIRTALVSAAVATAGLIGIAAPAHASVIPDGSTSNCGTGDAYRRMCLYYNSYDAGSHVGIFGTVYNYASNPTDCSSQGCAHYDFLTAGAGQLQAVKNNAASGYNYAPTEVYRVYYNSGYAGSADQFDPYGYGFYFGNLTNTYNNNASQQCMDGEGCV